MSLPVQLAVQRNSARCGESQGASKGLPTRRMTTFRISSLPCNTAILPSLVMTTLTRLLTATDARNSREEGALDRKLYFRLHGRESIVMYFRMQSHSLTEGPQIMEKENAEPALLLRHSKECIRESVTTEQGSCKPTRRTG